ncbi:hypothetical protein FBEOM_3447 [Fusarium beomiforme]|uniref:Uncharacterized protein n=1 Tax=Fusarium beomiforme TaxID=44412 RepID=A0A9P5APP2_9HYPO|nr:hypothetical protein FBEOM_3447 [Fusarium beomiforme]
MDGTLRAYNSLQHDNNMNAARETIPYIIFIDESGFSNNIPVKLASVFIDQAEDENRPSDNLSNRFAAALYTMTGIRSPFLDLKRLTNEQDRNFGEQMVAGHLVRRKLRSLRMHGFTDTHTDILRCTQEGLRVSEDLRP